MDLRPVLSVLSTHQPTYLPACITVSLLHWTFWLLGAIGWSSPWSISTVCQRSDLLTVLDLDFDSTTSTMSALRTARYFHVKCRFPHEYRYKGPEGQIQRIVRQEVPAGQIAWDTPYDVYDPISFTAPHVLTAPWADPPIGQAGFHPRWNQRDGPVNRQSHEGVYLMSDQQAPLNIRGRTGLKGRGTLGRWGPNHAADPVVTRWHRDSDGQRRIHPDSQKPVLQFVAIQRRDTGEWATPGGMVDPGELVSETVKREFMEEAMDSTQATAQEKAANFEMVRDFFTRGQEIYAGYVDDPRNTDQAWMETVAFLFHDDTGSEVGQFELKAGDDAQALQWMDISSDLNLYASHINFIQKAAELQDAHW
ncbi:hypothetical protein TCAL_02495 [Tigriopus californicus]|uniref:Nudix hydrolase domain-containing protein n=1 Tax=Tigriopus californicus TaxID=6832 RepID=A0A553NTJ0_TIGCA|nr:hypothetical protein TCAL_02495 [Tigriopus californicus]|eukprot:TCALIF_02495-PA protein Name:"Similar to NUDT9 ADP-ribose pyrophosphatase, mitochondrial (Homo sapiens)" AED:0.03 eAED:0.03 QI:373/1/1/1/0.75/0.6/5/274/363